MSSSAKSSFFVAVVLQDSVILNNKRRDLCFCSKFVHYCKMVIVVQLKKLLSVQFCNFCKKKCKREVCIFVIEVLQIFHGKFVFGSD